MSEPVFSPGDRVFSHYAWGWGTVARATRTERDRTHGVTKDPLPDTTWYLVLFDSGDEDLMDDAHGNWDLARIIPPHVAARYGYGTDPKETAS